jgi:enterochelin esterase-like enzyme/outer membrane protein assembly factor BamB
MRNMVHLWILAISSIIIVFFYSIGVGNPEGGEDKKTDWPNWRGVNHDGKSLATGVFKFEEGYGLKIAWKKPLGPGYSGVSVANGHAITMFSDNIFDFMIAFDAKNGDERWRFKIDSTFVGRDGAYNGPRSTPVINGDKVFGLGAKGQLFALEVRSGKKLWSTNIAKEHDGIAPYHGFTTSPLVYEDILVIETGGSRKNSISGFDKNSGKLLWATGTDTVHYQSPISMLIAGESQLLCAGDKYLYGLNHTTGNVLWEFNHNGGNPGLNPVKVANNRLMLNSGRESILIQVNKENERYDIEEVWKSRAIKNTFDPSVYHEGYLYGYSRNFLTCADAATGEKIWRSRPPGHGFVILGDGHLVILTTGGTLHIAEASPAGYREKVSVQVFDAQNWTPPSFAGGRIYVRDISEIAGIELAPVSKLVEITPAEPGIIAPESEFAAFVRRVEAANNKKELIDEFMDTQKQFPIIEKDNIAHFVYRGEVEEIAMLGDMFDLNEQVVMNRIAGTDFYYQTVELEPDAHLSYWFLKDFEEQITDPLNSAKATNFVFNEVSEITMPKYAHPTHLNEPTGARGKLDSLQFESKILGNTRKVEVYLPHGYEQGNHRYPVIYVNYGREAVQIGNMPNTLDNLIGKSVSPVIAVFIHAPNSFQEYARDQRKEYAQMVVEELVPYIDKNFRTEAKPESRALMGADEGGFSAFFTAFRHPGVFGMVASQSAHLHPPEGDELINMVVSSEKLPLNIYLDWGKYDYRNPAAGFNWVENNQKFAALLKEKGYRISGGQVNDGFDWPSWRARTDRILEAFFPIKELN